MAGDSLLQGDGSCVGGAENTFPWVNQTEHGTVWWSDRPERVARCSDATASYSVPV